MKGIYFSTIIVLGCALISSCARPAPLVKKTISDVQATKSLQKHTEEFEQKVYRVSDNVYSAVGFGLANSIMIEGDDGLIIVDTMESTNEAKTVIREFRKITHKPVKAIVYTHNHTDHVFGAQVFAGTLNISAPVIVEVTAAADETALADIGRLMETAGQGKEHQERE